MAYVSGLEMEGKSETNVLRIVPLTHRFLLKLNQLSYTNNNNNLHTIDWALTELLSILVSRSIAYQTVLQPNLMDT